MVTIVLFFSITFGKTVGNTEDEEPKAHKVFTNVVEKRIAESVHSATNHCGILANKHLKFGV